MRWLIFLFACTAAERTPSPTTPAPPPVATPAAATAAAGDVYDRRGWPDPDWPTATPADVRLDPAGLDQAAAAAEKNGSYCLLVIRHGALVYERYFNGSDASTTHKSWSLAKSYSGTLVGIAVDRGDIRSLDDKVSDYVADWRGTDRDAVIVRDLVRMTSGLQWSAFQDYVQMATLAQDDTQFALALPLSDPPGSKWIYHNGAVQMLEPLFRGATGMTIEAYADQYLWSKIGMAASWAHDSAGNPTPYANVLATCRDHARLGYLYLRRGHWGKESVLSEKWVSEALAPSQPYNRAYGHLFWLNRETPALDAMMQPWPGRMVPYAPADLFAARGFGNQFIDVIPSLDLVIVRFGVDPLTGFDLVAMVKDSQFTLHDEILQPILGALR
jgi:CubicO group peptidase (beta-lactamase class C family)